MKNSFILLSAMFVAGCSAEDVKKPNVIVLLADDLGFVNGSYESPFMNHFIYN